VNNLAVVLMTCDRPECTRQCVDSFQKHMGQPDLFFPIRFFHVDDASVTGENAAIARQAGFETIYASSDRIGINRMRKLIVRYLQTGPKASHVLILENDWHAVRDILWSELYACISDPDIDSVRLYGEFKRANNSAPAGNEHLSKNKKPAHWTPYRVAGFEVGDIHWGAPPNIISVHLLGQILQGTTKGAKAMRNCAHMRLTVRPTENFMECFADYTTPGGLR
jgi:hypothetical protein